MTVTLNYLGLIACVISISSFCAGQGKDAAKTRYSDVPFELTVDHLSAGYQGNDADRIYRAIEKHENAAKGEFETTEQYEARIEQQNEQPLIGSLRITSLFAFKAADLKLQYDADSGVIKIYVPTSFAVDDAGKVDSSRIAVKVQESASSRSYLASNAFGATTMVREKDVKSIEIGVVHASDFELRNDADPNLDCFYGPDLGCFYSELHLVPEQARRLKRSARVLIVGSLDHDAIGKGAILGDATINSPTAYFGQLRYINLRLSEIWIYNPETGTVFAKIKAK